MRFKPGDRVKIVERPMTAADAKSALFFDYFCNLTGTVSKVYDDGTLTVDIDLDSLPEDVRRRHHEIEESVRRRWLDGLSEENRDKLSEKESAVKLEYKILIAESDLVSLGKSSEPSSSKPKSSASASASEKKSSRSSAEKKESRPTEADLARAEAEHLKEIAKRIQSGA
mgnify:CR=1 FL=1